MVWGSGDEFKSLLEPYLHRGLSKGIPSLFADIKSLCTDPSKRAIIEQVAETFKDSHQPPPTPPEGDAEVEPPTDYLWTLYFLAQHYSTFPSSQSSPSTTEPNHTHALQLLDLAISHTPTLPELYMYKARVLKRLGDPYGAVRAMEEARRLDGQDRFLNAKCGKYWLRAGGSEEAQEVFGLFTKVRHSCPLLLFNNVEGG